MKKNLLKGLAVAALGMLGLQTNAQVRYIDPVFNDVTKTANIMYDSNMAVNILFGQVPGIQPLFSNKLMCDVYTPSGDNVTKRPLVILAHTGSYLPSVVNQQTTGNKNDSSIVEVATQLAKRGYVVAAINYRSGWNAATTVQSVAREQLLKATYRGLQDVRNAVRFFRSNASTYGIDTSKIILGGQGTGGYIALAGATVSTREDIESNIKFLRGDASPMVNMDTLGDWRGLGGLFPHILSGDPNISSEYHMVFNWGGAMGDTAWMKSTSLPIVSLHCKGDQFAPFLTGNVVVPTTGAVVIPNASGGGHVVPKANGLGLNNKIDEVEYMDAVSDRASQISMSAPHLFPFETSFPFEGSPWEWWDRAAMQAVTAVPYAGAPTSAPFFGFIPANGRNADSLSMLTNPTMSAAKGKAYCDTIVKFVAPRIAQQFGITGAATLNPFNLLTPANNTTAIIYEDTTIEYTISWQKSADAAAAPGATGYVFLLDLADGDFEDPIVTDELTDTTSFTVANNDIYDLLVDLNVPAGDTANLKWMVVAVNDYFARGSSAVYNVNFVRNSTVGINEADYSNFLAVYPNPAKSELNIKMSDAKSPMSQIVILDIMGREVMSMNELNTHNQKMNVSSLSTGIYFVNIKTANGGTATKRFVIN